MSKITMQLKRLEHPEPQRQQVTEGSVGRTLKVNRQMRIVVDDAYLKEVEKWSRYNENEVNRAANQSP